MVVLFYFLKIKREGEVKKKKTILLISVNTCIKPAPKIIEVNKNMQYKSITFNVELMHWQSGSITNEEEATVQTVITKTEK